MLMRDIRIPLVIAAGLALLSASYLGATGGSSAANAPAATSTLTPQVFLPVVLKASAGTPQVTATNPPTATTTPTATSPPTATPTTPPPTAVSVNIGPAIAFSPADVTVKAGGTVTWTWQGSFLHSTTSGTCAGVTCTKDDKWDSGQFSSGHTFAITGGVFNTPGNYTYFCSVHLSAMTAVVHVVP
jgi:plastocyanin